MIEETSPLKRYNKLIKIGSITLGVLILVSIFNPFVIVSAGHRGVVLNFGSVQDKVLEEGLHFRLPIKQKVKILDVRTVKHEVDTLAYSKDIQTVAAKVALNYHIEPSKANTLYQQIGADYETRIIDPSIQESVKATTAKFTAQELIEKRQVVKEEIQAVLSERMKASFIHVDQFSIVNFDFSDEYENAVEAKQVAQQSALKAENDLTRIKTEAEQRIAQAEAEARAIQIQAEAITQQGGAEYVNLKAVEKWNGVLPTQFVPGSALPFLNLNK